MASAPLNWLLKIGGTALKTTAQTLSEAVNWLYDKVIALDTTVENKADVSEISSLTRNKLNISDLLDLEEIAAATDLTNKGAAAEAVKEVNDSLGGVSQFIVDESTGEISGYKTEIGGADTVFPFKRGGLLAFTNYGYGQGANIKAGNSCYDNTYIASVNVSQTTNTSDTRTITFKKDCNISLFQSLHCGTTWTQVVVTLNGTEILKQRLTKTDASITWYDILNLTIKSGDIITVQYTCSNIAYVGGETVITFS